MRIIFLDVDGVLNSINTRTRYRDYVGVDERNLLCLKKLVDLTDAKIVVSSSWRHEKTRDGFPATGLFQYLKDTLGKVGLEVYDITPDLSVRSFERGKEINTWLQSNVELGITGWLVIDDEYYQDFDQYGINSHLIETNFYTKEGGLLPKDIEKGVEILMGIGNEENDM